MGGIVRDGDLCSGHGSHPPRTAETFSSNVFVNGKGVVRLGDTWTLHTDGISPHVGVQTSASTTVRANGQGVARIGDSIGGGCASTNAQGSPNVIAG